MAVEVLERISSPRGYSLSPYCSLYLPFYHLDGRSDGLDVSFKSKDHYGHAVTNSGAKWTPQGYLFDGVDDIIVVPDHTAIQNIFDSPGGTIVAWINAESAGEGGVSRIADKANYYLYMGANSVAFFHDFSTTDGVWSLTGALITYLKPIMVSVSYNNGAVTNDPVICIDGNPVAITEISTPVGTRVSDATNSLCVGNNVATSRTFDGYINALWAFKGKMLSPVESQSLFLATKGRFGR